MYVCMYVCNSGTICKVRLCFRGHGPFRSNLVRLDRVLHRWNLWHQIHEIDSGEVDDQSSFAAQHFKRLQTYIVHIC